MNVLLVEDNRELSRLLVKILERNNYLVSAVYSLEEAEEAISLFDFDIVILDRCLGVDEGLSLIKFSSRRNKRNRFLVLSALDNTSDRILGLNAGAIDYIVKPFEPDELLARMKIVLRYPLEEAKDLKTLAHLSYDPVLRSFFLKDEPLELRRREALLLEALFTRERRVVRREVLHDAIFGVDSFTSEAMLEPHVSRLRKKLKAVGSGLAIRTHRGLGYSLELA